MGVEDDTLSYGLGLASVLQTMLDSVALYSRATDYHGARCTSCHGTTYRGRPQGTGLEHGKEVAYECWSAARSRGATDPHRSTNSVSTASTINTSRRCP